MAALNDKWIAEPKLAFEDIEICMQDEAWGSDHSIEVPAYHRRRAAGLWTALASLAVALAVVASYGYSLISKDNAQLAWLPGLAKSLSSTRHSLNGLETRLQAWQDRQKILAAQIQQVDTEWKSKLNEARLSAAKLMTDAYQRQRNELDQRTAMLNEGIARMTALQRAEHTHVAQLEQELVRTRQELASVSEGYNNELAVLQQQQASNQREIASLDQLLSTDEVDFEIEKKQDEEIAPGVSLHLTNTDKRHQRFQGWIRLAANRRTIWVRGQDTQRPVVFYPKPGSEAYELVVTKVNQKGATGYLLIPGDSATQQAALDSDKKSGAGASQVRF